MFDVWRASDLDELDELITEGILRNSSDSSDSDIYLLLFAMPDN
jgi:hypothetical protein